MKNKLFLLTIGFLLFFASAFGQVTNKIQADSTRLWQTGSNPFNELIIENRTRTNTGAFLRNRWNGRTEFAYALDSVWQDGDLLKFNRGGSILTINMNGLESIASKLDSVRVRKDSVFYYKNGGQEYFAGSLGLDTTLTFATRHWVFSNFYSQSNLQTSGQASVHWDNLTNKPANLGSLDTTAGDTRYIKNGTTAQTASFNVTGNGTVGSTLNVKGRTTFDSTVIFASEAVPPPVVNGGQYYNTTTNKMQIGENGVWKNQLQDFVTAKTIYVDAGSANATNTRTGLSKYDFNRPFSTLQAAVDVVSEGDIIYIKNAAAANLTYSGTASFTIAAESRASIAKITLTQDIVAGTYGIRFINIDFGSASATYNLFETQSQQRMPFLFYNCNFYGTKPMFYHLNTWSGGVMKLYYCTVDMPNNTTSLIHTTKGGGYSGMLYLYNSYVNAPKAVIHSGVGYAFLGDMLNSVLYVAGAKSQETPMIHRAINIADCYIRCFNDKFFGTGLPAITSAAYSYAIIRNSTIISQTIDTIAVNNYGANTERDHIYIENNYFSGLLLSLDTGAITTARQTIHLKNNTFNYYDSRITIHDSLILDNENNKLAPDYSLAIDGNSTLKTDFMELPTITANRTVTIPSFRNKDFRIRLAVRNTNATYRWSTNHPIRLIDGTTTTTLANGTVYELVSDGTEWRVTNNLGTVTAGSSDPSIMNLTSISGGPVTHTLESSWHLISAEPTTGDITVNLPAVATPGKTYVIKKAVSSVYKINVIPTSGQTIDGSPTWQIISDWQVSRIYFNGTNWLTW